MMHALRYICATCLLLLALSFASAQTKPRVVHVFVALADNQHQGIAPVLSLSMAFLAEPQLGMAGRGWRSLFGLISLFVGVMMHLVASIGAPRIDTTPQRP